MIKCQFALNPWALGSSVADCKLLYSSRNSHFKKNICLYFLSDKTFPLSSNKLFLYLYCERACLVLDVEESLCGPQDFLYHLQVAK